MKRALVAALVIASAFGAGRARAGSPAPKKSETEIRAERWFKAGLEQTRTGNHQAALASFSAAYADVPSVDILWNLASTERHVGRTVSALAHLRAYLEHPNARADRRPMAEQWIEELAAQVGKVTLTSSPSADVVIDGAPRAQGPIELLPGIHSITARCDDHAKTVAIDLVAGERRDVTLLCEPVPATPVLVAKTEAPPAPVMQAITITKPASSARTWTVLGLTAGAALSVAGGVFFASQAASAQGQADGAKVSLGGNGFSCKSSGSLCADYDDARSRATRDAGISTGLFVLSGLSAGAAVATYLLWPKETETKLVRVAPTVTKDAAAVTISGRF